MLYDDATKVDLLLKTLPSLDVLQALPPNWLWPSLISEGSFHLLSGEPGSMKSMLALALGIGISTGNVLGYNVEPRPVIYVDRENPDTVVKERYEKLKLDKCPNLWYWGMWYQNPEPPFATDTMYLELIKKFEKPVIIFDSLVRFHNKDENDAGEMSVITASFRRLAAHGATVILLHHRGKPNAEGTSSPYRGSSEINGACDIGYGITKKVDALNTTTLELTAFKNRYEEEKTIKFLFKLKDDGGYTFVPTEIQMCTQNELFLIKEYVRKHPNTGPNEISMGTKIGVNKVRDVLNEFKGLSFQTTKQGQKVLWSLSDSKQES